jgi:hypothetical protein
MEWTQLISLILGVDIKFRFQCHFFKTSNLHFLTMLNNPHEIVSFGETVRGAHVQPNRPSSERGIGEISVLSSKKFSMSAISSSPLSDGACAFARSLADSSRK